jgi:hypothetical protein
MDVRSWNVVCAVSFKQNEIWVPEVPWVLKNYSFVNMKHRSGIEDEKRRNRGLVNGLGKTGFNE